MAHPNRTDVVAAVKAELERRGVTLAGDCGAFEVTKRVAWRLRSDGAGVLAKPSGANCQGFAPDIIVFRDGEFVDILRAAGAENGPQWLVQDGTLPDRWRAPVDPGDDVVQPPAPPQPPPPPQPPTPPPGSAPPTFLLDALLQLGKALDANSALHTATNEKLDQLLQRGVRLHF